jgi:hypothetical protein
VNDWVQQPLVHYLLLGAAVLAVQSVRGNRSRVVVTQERQAALQAELETGLGRPATPDEQQMAVWRWVDQELAVREAHALGLHVGDPVVRRRLIQKIEFLDQNQAVGLPSEDDLAFVLSVNPERFWDPPTVSLEQQLLREGQPVAAPLPATLTASPLQDVADLFGAEFVVALEDAPLDTWIEVESVYGTHRVRVVAQTQAQPTGVDDHRDELEALWEAHERENQVRDRKVDRRGRANVVVE